MSQYTEKDAAKETGDSIKQVNRTWHGARDDAAQAGGEGVPADRHGDGGGVVGGILSGIGNILKGGKRED